MSTTASLRSVIEAPKRLDELSTARVIEQAAEAIHKAQKGGQPLGSVCPEAIQIAATGIELVPPAAPPGGYTAPEVLQGNVADRRSDVFSLGVVLWEALAHARLFGATTNGERRAEILAHEFTPPSWNNANIPAELDAICKKALSKEPGERYPSLKVMAAEISTVLDDAGYPEDQSVIVAYLRDAFPPSSAPAPDAPLVAKLAATPVVTRTPLNQTMMGMTPLKEPVVALTKEPEKVVELTQEKVVELTELKAPIIAEPNVRARTPSAAPVAPPRTKSISQTPPITVPEIRPTTPASKPATTPPPIANPMVTLPFGSMAISRAEIATEQLAANQAVPAMLVDPSAGAKPTIASAETIATPALVPVGTPKLAVDKVAPASGVAGLPALPPGAMLSPAAADDFAASDRAPRYPDGPPLMPAPIRPEPEIAPATLAQPAVAASASVATVDPTAAVSLPRARRESHGDLDRWVSSTDSHAAIDDEYESEIEAAQRKQKKRLLIAIASAFGVIAVVLVIALVVGGDAKKVTPPETAHVGSASRTAPELATEPGAKATDSVPPELPAGVASVGAGMEPAVAGSGSAEAVDEAAQKIARDEAANQAAAKLAADSAEAARVAKEADDQRLAEVRQAELDAEKSAQLEADDARRAKLEQDKVAKAAANDKVKLEREAKAEAARAVKATAATKAEATRVANQAQRKKAAAAEKVRANAPKPKSIAKKEPTKKQPKRVAVAEPVDPYAEPKPSSNRDPAQAYKLGFQQYVRGDTAGALTTLRDSLSANPGYPPTYRGLGLVYEKIGQKNQARRAFSRYLQLSPSASDADQIRDRMERL